ncbi:MAG: hypothetical protein WKF97_11275 [Chitinophagaceae bacterium]
MKQVSNTKNLLVLSSSLRHSFNPRSFSKYCLVLLLAGITLLISSCHKEDNNKKTVPLKGEFVASVMLIVPPSPGVLEQIRVTGTGSGTPFGKATYESDVTVDVTASPEITSGTDTITAENGDQIFSTISGYIPGPDANGNFQVFNTHTITGGSGKYAGATGTYKVTSKGTSKSPTVTATLDGSITY